MTRLTPSMTAGLVAGLLFFAHAMISNSHAWPLIWPIAGGAAAVWFAARAHRLHGFWSGLRAGAGAGLVAGGFFFAATVIALRVLNLRELGSEALIGLAIAAAIGGALAVVAGALAFPFARRAA